MSLAAVFVALTVAVILASPVVNGNCDNNIVNNVSLTLNVAEICPYQRVIAQCTVKKPPNSPNPFLSWHCSGQNGQEEERLVFCNTGALVDLHCQFGEVFDVTGACGCNDTVIMSNVTFIVPPSGDVILNCSNGEQTKQVVNSMSATETPKLEFIELRVKNNMHDVEIMWSDNNIYSDIEYVLSVSNSSSSGTQKPVEFVTTVKRKRLTLYAGVQYNISVTAQRCDGNMTSNPSADLYLYFDDTPTESEEGQGLAVGLAVAGFVAIAAIIIILFVIIVVYKRRRQLKNREGHGEDMLMSKDQVDTSHKVYLLEQVSEQYGEDIKQDKAKAIAEPVENGENIRRRGVAAIVVDRDFVYYSCCTHNKSQYYIRKCRREKDGENVQTLAGYRHLDDGFQHARGIGKDGSNNFYVLDGENWRILKFDKNWGAVRQIQDSESFDELFGLLVTSQYVLVCTKRHNKILIFNHNLNFCFKLDLPTGPTGIAEQDGKYFVTTKHAVLVVEIDFQEEKYFVNKIKSMIMNNSKEESFKNGSELRDICASGQYLYVVERASRILCLKYVPDKMGGKLLYITEAQCSSYAIASHGDEVYCGRKDKKEEFYISKLTESGGKIKIEDLFKA